MNLINPDLNEPQPSAQELIAKLEAAIAERGGLLGNMEAL